MKTKFLSVVIFLITFSVSFAQIQKGDASIGLQGNLNINFFEQNTSTTSNINFTYSRSLSDNFELTAGFPFTVSSFSGSTTVSVGLLSSAQFYFSTNSTVLPFIAGSVYMPNLISSEKNSPNVVISTGGAGLRIFLNKNFSIKSDLNLGIASAQSTTSFSYFLNTGLLYNF